MPGLRQSNRPRRGGLPRTALAIARLLRPVRLCRACNEGQACGVKQTMEITERISALLHEAAETHHLVYRIVDGDDPDWASWYAGWLIELSELPKILGAKPVRSHLVHALVELDRNYTTEAPDLGWEAWYAERLPVLV